MARQLSAGLKFSCQNQNMNDHTASTELWYSQHDEIPSSLNFIGRNYHKVLHYTERAQIPKSVQHFSKSASHNTKHFLKCVYSVYFNVHIQFKYVIPVYYIKLYIIVLCRQTERERERERANEREKTKI